MAAQGIFPLPAIRENVRRFLIKRHMLANIEEIPIVAKRARRGRFRLGCGYSGA
jgi:circadian clock protein KaiC